MRSSMPNVIQASAVIGTTLPPQLQLWLTLWLSRLEVISAVKRPGLFQLSLVNPVANRKHAF